MQCGGVYAMWWSVSQSGCRLGYYDGVVYLIRRLAYK
jgi:hypothetical protein